MSNILKEEFMNIAKDYGFFNQNSIAKALYDKSDFYNQRTLASVTAYFNLVITGKRKFPKEMVEPIIDLLKGDERAKKFIQDHPEKRNHKKNSQIVNKNKNFNLLYEQYSIELEKYFKRSDESKKIKILGVLESLVRD